VSERENRVITSLDPTEYHGIERLSSSGCKMLLRSPLHYRVWRATPRVATPAMQFGSAVHTLAFEPDRFAERVVQMPSDAPTRQSNAGKEWHADFRQRHDGKIVLSSDDYARCVATARAAVNSYGYERLIRRGHIETSMLWRDPATDVLCKARTDWFSDDGSVIVDLKTTADASRESFMRQLWNLRYDIQAAFYMEALQRAAAVMPHSFVWCAVESEPPHGVAWYRMGHSELEVARADIENALHLYAECTRFNTWERGYPTEVQEIRLPPWARRRNNEAPIQEF
jgi:hypothetical protein